MGASIYTFGHMAAAEVDSATSEATGFPKENLIDFNPDTYWKPTSTASQTIDIDLQSAKAVSALVLLVQNYSTDLSGATVYVQLLSSDDDSSYTSRYLELWAAPTTGPIYTIDLAATYTHRYWRLVISAVSSVVQLSGIWLAKKQSLTMWHQYPDADTTIYAIRRITAPSGRVFTEAINSNSVSEIPRTYILQQTDYTALKAAFDDSKGGMYPAVLVEDTVKKLVRFADDRFTENEVAYQLYNPTVTFIEMPYIPSGGTY